MELKDKVGSFDDDILAESDVFVPASDERSEAVAALIALGYTKNEAADAVGKVKKEDLTCEEYIKKRTEKLILGDRL